MASEDTAIVAKSKSDTPYQLDNAEVFRASQALLKHVTKSQIEQSATSKDLFKATLAGPEDDPQPIWLVLTTKKAIADKTRLKPGKILLPHALIKHDTSVCLITADPQKTYKEIIADPAFPDDLRSRIRVLGITKLKQRYKSFESRRQLRAEYDTFLADDRVVTMLTALLGKTFLQSQKRPIPVNLLARKTQSKEPKTPQPKPKDSPKRREAGPSAMAKEIEKTLRSARVHIAPSTTTAVQVGLSHFTPEQLRANVQTVVEGMQEKFVPKGWRGIRSIHIKGSETAALPIWLAKELWVDEDDVLEDQEAEEAKNLASQKGKKRKSRKDGNEAEVQSKKPKLLGTDEGFSKEMAARREALRQQKRQAEEELVKETTSTEAITAA